MSKLLEMLGCRYPIIQGPIGMFNSPRMVAAVSEAGGYGLLAIGFINDGDTLFYYETGRSRKACLEQSLHAEPG